MIFLGLLFIIQFSISVAALAIGNNQQDQIASSGWCKLSDPDKNDIQREGNCFGFQDLNPASFNSTSSDMCMGPGTFCPTSTIFFHRHNSQLALFLGGAALVIQLFCLCASPAIPS
jgi:hypothetical protein